VINKSKKLVYRDGISFITAMSALIILWTHHSAYTVKIIYSIPQFLIDRTAPVIFALGAFVFISGFKLINSHLKTNLTDFFHSRFLRVIPLYYVSLLLFILFMRNNITLPKLLIHLFGGQLIFPHLFKEMLPTLWFIGLIFVYYILFIVMRSFIGNKPKFFFISFFLYGILLLLDSCPYTADKIIDSRVLLYFPYFILGIYFGKYHEATINKFRNLVTLYLLFFGSMILSNIYFYPPSKNFEILFHQFFHLPLNIILLLVTLRVKFTGKIKDLIFSLSFASFSIYLFHRPIWYAMNLIYHKPTPYQHLYIFFIGIPTIFIVSYIIQRSYNGLLKIVMS